MQHADLTEKIIGCAYAIANGLGSGFLEKVYENALAHELTKAGLVVGQQIAIGVEYDGVIVGAYVADLLVENAGWWKSRRSEPWIRTTTLNA